jgi:hypothetical protein
MRAHNSKLDQQGYVREDVKGREYWVSLGIHKSRGGIIYLFPVSCHHVSAEFHLLSHFVNNLLGLIRRLRLKVVLFRLVGPPDD